MEEIIDSFVGGDLSIEFLNTTVSYVEGSGTAEFRTIIRNKNVSTAHITDSIAVTFTITNDNAQTITFERDSQTGEIAGLVGRRPVSYDEEIEFEEWSTPEIAPEYEVLLVTTITEETAQWLINNKTGFDDVSSNTFFEW